MVCLVTALTIEDFLDPDMTVNSQPRPPQVGVITLAAILRNNGFRLTIVNLDDLYFKFLDLRKAEPARSEQAGAGIDGSAADTVPSSDEEAPPLFLPFVLQHLDALWCDAVGCSSICSSYPLTLRLAREIKQLHPDIPLIFGGPQASVVDIATMDAFPCVDFVVRGEADHTFPALLKMLFAGDGSWEQLPGITFRRGGKVISKP